MLSVLPSLLVLGLAALAALSLTLSRQSSAENVTERRAAARALAVAVIAQGIHFAEETATGFPERLGALLGLPPMTLSLFVAFNLGWLTIWIASVPGLRSARPTAYFAAWFSRSPGCSTASRIRFCRSRRPATFPVS